MTTIPQAGTHRPPTFPTSATPHRPLKRQASITTIGKIDGEILRHPAEEDSVSKRQKRDTPFSTANTSNSPSHEINIGKPTANRLARARDTKRLPLELIDGFFVGSEGVQDSHAQSPVGGRSSPPSLPQRPWKHNSVARKVNKGGLNNTGVRKRDDIQVQSVPYKTEPPRDAPTFMADNRADFAPWLGNHPEDVLNEQTVKHGFVDRTPVSQYETNTARQSLYGLFRHRSGLQTLSALFASVVEKREAYSKMSPGSAFKPPPRVTLTEAKRRAWLSDLANPAVPLRKLSRTIPQGIRGQTLLDQCMANNVPIGRALWLAKCVGANEIRTLKRKGTSGAFAAGAEIKWLRDWTTNIEQFLESSMEHSGQPDWRPRTHYSLSLVIRLYSECLLDRDHYLDWVVKSLSSASPVCLPVWLMMVNLHKPDLVKHRKRGRSLAEYLLERLSNVAGHPQSPLTPLVGKLKHILRWMIQSNIACFVMPRTWSKYRDALESCFNSDVVPDKIILKQLVHRNERLSFASGPTTSVPRTPRQIVLHILDTASSPFDIRKITQDCQTACQDADVLIKIVLEWCSSRFRTGQYRVYLAVQLIRICQEEADVNSAVTDFLALQHTQVFCDVRCLSLLVSELVRSKVFALGRYLQWLTASGTLRCDSFQTDSSDLFSHTNEDSMKAEGSLSFRPAQVLTMVPLSSLKPSVRNLRNILLAQVGFSAGCEAHLLDFCKRHMAMQLPRILGSEVDPILDTSVCDFAELSRSTKVELALFLKHQTESFTTPKISSGAKDNGQSPPTLLITDAEFRLIRRLCENLDDLSVLADIISLCTSSADEMLLASITDTVSYHLDAFSALGAFEDLHSGLFQAYMCMRTNSELPRHFIVSLVSLGSLVSSNLVSLSILQQDLARGDRSLAVAACSPVSDGMAESLQQAGPSFIERFETVLSTGNRMEEQTMTQLFNVLARRLEKGHYQIQAENDEVLCALYARLRVYRLAQFEALIATWLRKILNTANSRVKQLLPVLISTNCISFEAFVDILIEAMDDNEDPTTEVFPVRSHLIGFLAMIVAAENGLDSVSYKLKLENARHINTSPHRALELRARAGFDNNLKGAQPWDNLLIRLVLSDGKIDALSATVFDGALESVLNGLLRLPRDVSVFDFSELAKNTNDLSMPFCRLRLQLWAAASSLSSLASGQEAVVETLFDLAKSESDSSWIYYTKAIGVEAASRLRGKAEEAFFALPIIPLSGRTPSTALPRAAYIDQAGKYLRIVSSTAYSIPPGGVQGIISILVDRFAVVLRGLTGEKTAANSDNINPVTTQPVASSEESAPRRFGHMITYLTLLIRMTSIHRTGFVSSRVEPLSLPVASQKQSQQDVVKILVLLVNIALHPSLDAEPCVAGHILDVAAAIVDDASEEVRALCARILKDKMRDQRAEYLFGSANATKGIGSLQRNSQAGWTTDGLHIVKDGKRVGDYRSRNWEMLEGGAEASISLSLFETKREV
ncbi:hypothetical protein EPUS_07989 [Endocarpon pusillum Z07020]|uniref:Mediator of RNA polymerase II transcription subunit 12 n=1 Tax=Endocarpon pusillum (strain Z07020 / HMAS-L-300199) TaxID=1263415 RepID=U1I3Z9_ENDPU|nr:uncharacterized protein EPUS_07989 [Endocarpon pusillum Z07020]ERF76809.1 hypothetical protein EPUS_07989 [Endocarpon pusillum Z07020]